MEQNPIARLTGVVRRYGDVTALDGVDLAIHPGELLGLLGPNGAGKSTIINLLLGLRRAHEGSVELFGGSPQDPASRRRMGCTPQETSLPANLRVGEVVRWVAGHFPDPIPTDELLERFGLQDLQRRQTGGLSGGQRRKLSVALALVGRPEFVLLDEPSTGLDVDARHELWDSLREVHAAGTTVLLTSHYLEDIDALAERVVVLGGGHVLADDTLEHVLAAVGVQLVSLRLPDGPGEAGLRSGLADLPGLVRHSRERNREVLYVSDADAVVRELVSRGTPFTGLRVRGATLEEAFQAMTGGAPTTLPAQPDALSQPVEVLSR
jgi:ABC-2 type transport system ATP-binding protein